jgi:hypothetical protein
MTVRYRPTESVRNSEVKVMGKTFEENGFS